MAALAMPLISGLGSLFGGLFGASGANKAAQQQVDAEKQAQAQLQQTQGQVMGQLQPYANLGQQGASTMSQMLPSVIQPWTQTFNAPTEAEAQATPGYQFTRDQGIQAAQSSAAAKGGLLSGGTMADLAKYTTGLADSTYNDVFNRSLTGYQQNYNSFLNNQSNTYNRLMGVTGLGLDAAGSMGQLATGIGGDIASLYGSQGQARASGTLGASNAYSNMFSNMSNTANQALMMHQMNPFNTTSTASPNLGGGPGTLNFYDPNNLLTNGSMSDMVQ